MSARADDARAGYTLAEALLALLLAGILMACLAGILGVVGRLAGRHERVATEAETERVVAAVLGAELRTLTAADALFDSDSVRLRAFRGMGVVCAAGERELTVRYRGVREPEPDKDSVLLVWPAGEAARALGGVAIGASCPALGETGLKLRVDWQAAARGAPPAIALVFETGAYSISGAAFRYRRGAGGRQPLTETSLSDAASGLTLSGVDGTAGTAAVISLLPMEARGAVPLSWRLLMPQGGVRPGGLDR